MNATLSLAKPVAAKNTHQRQPKTGGVDLGRDTSREAKRVAAAILEVLAGARTPSEAATALAMSVPHYYQVESRALRGLLAACEPKPRGRVRSPESEVTALRHDNQRLQREITRQQALVRAAQRTVGLTPPATPPPGKTSSKKIRKRKVARALNIASRLQQTADVVMPAIVPQPLNATL
jgi:hypothetical protein